MTVELLPPRMSPEDTADHLEAFSLGIDCPCGKSKALPPYTSVVFEVADWDLATAWFAKHVPYPPVFGDEEGWHSVIQRVEKAIVEETGHGLTAVCPMCTGWPDEREQAIAQGHVVPLRAADR